MGGATRSQAEEVGGRECRAGFSGRQRRLYLVVLSGVTAGSHTRVWHSPVCVRDDHVACVGWGRAPCSLAVADTWVGKEGLHRACVMCCMDRKDDLGS